MASRPFAVAREASYGWQAILLWSVNLAVVRYGMGDTGKVNGE